MLSHDLSQLSNGVYFSWIDAKFPIFCFLLWLLLPLISSIRLRFLVAAGILLPTDKPFHTNDKVGQIFSLRNYASIFNDLRDLLSLSHNFFTGAPIEHKFNLIA